MTYIMCLFKCIESNCYIYLRVDIMVYSILNIYQSVFII